MLPSEADKFATLYYIDGVFYLKKNEIVPKEALGPILFSFQTIFLISFINIIRCHLPTCLA